MVYACPSFWKRADLWRYIRGKLVENSNFVQPIKLQGHRRYTFIRDGNLGEGFSKPAEIPSLNILAEIDGMFEKGVRFDNNTQFIGKLATAIRTVIKEESKPRMQESFFILERTIGFPEHSLGNDLVTILTFSYITAATWIIGYETRQTPRDDLCTNGRLKGFLENI